MALRVFISHSIRDFNLIMLLKYCLEHSGIEVYVFEESPQPGIPISDKVTKAIDTSDCVVAFMTIDGSRSEWVQNEIGYAKGKGKMIIPIVEQGVTVRGFLGGLEYIPFTWDNPYAAMNQTAYHLALEKVKKEGRERGNAILAIIIMFLTLVALSGQSR